MTTDQVIRKQLLVLLGGGEAHAGLDDVASDFPLEEINRKLPDGSYTAWHLLEHMRIAQWDILEYIRNPDHVSPGFPEGYWPGKDQMATAAQWKNTVAGIKSDSKDLQKLVKNPEIDLFRPLPKNREHTIYREVLLAADHNAYHLGALSIFKRIVSK